MSKELPTVFQQFIHKSKYARWIPELNRRENWPETVARYFDFFEGHLKQKHNFVLDKELRRDLETSVLNLEAMPSMRAMMTAGPALARDNIAGFNCSYLPIDNLRAFDEILYILMNGTGVGFSVERQYVEQLPQINEHFENSSTVIVVDDSKQGWAKATRELIALLYQGQVPKWDTSNLRPAGARLKTFGGRSSGPKPLEGLFNFTVNLIRNAAGRKLNSLECHDLVCKIAEIVVVGGVRRSALISLSDLSDARMRDAKNHNWWEFNTQRALANNSVSYTCKPDPLAYIKEWTSLIESGSGERGVYNRQAAKKQAARNGRRDVEHEFGTNPCSEIILRPYQFCNLSEVVVRNGDTEEQLMKKVRVATILGTFQSTLTDFKYLRKVWERNTEQERLLGVSMTGILDHDTLAWDTGLLSRMKEYAVEVNKQMADAIGIEQSTAVTCVKPSGTVSKLVDSASGLHARFNHYYAQTVRGDKKDPLTQFMASVGIPCEDAVRDPYTSVFTFAIASPKGAKTRNDLTAMEQMEVWLNLQRYWCEHKPSCTVYVKPQEWIKVGSWVYDHFDEVSGISFLPHTDHVYEQAPWQDITAEDYAALEGKMPAHIDWDLGLSQFEKEDATTGMQELACSAGVCEVVDIAKAI